MATHSRGQNVKRVEVVWPEEFVNEIDVARGPLSRSQFLRRASQHWLENTGPWVELAAKVSEKSVDPKVEIRNRADRLIRENAVALDRLAEGPSPKSARERLAERTALLREGKNTQ